MNLPTVTLLIVEDFPASRELYRNCLLTEGSYAYDFLEAESMAEGLELCRTRFSRGEASSTTLSKSTPTIDAILLDYLLPDGDGLKFLETLSAQNNGSIPPVVMMTGHGDENIAVRAIKLGAQDYLAKHKFTPELLVSTMRSAIDNAQLRQLSPQSDDLVRVSKLNDRFVATWQDVTVQRQAEQEGDRFFNLSLDLLAIGNFDGYFIHLNPAFEQTLGFTAAELMAQPFLDFVHPDDREQTITCATRLSAGQIEIDFENRYRCQDGSYRWLSWSAIPYTERNLWYAVGRDITERKQTDRCLQESQAQLKTGIEVAGIGLAKFDYVSNLVELSPAAAALYGLPAQESVVSRDRIHATFHPDDRAELEQQIAQVLDPQGTGWFAQDHRVVWPSGEVRCLSVRKQVFFDRSGAVARPSYAILAAIDITERNRTQTALEHRNQELDSFVHIVAHDLKAPLRVIANLSEWIEEDLAGTLTVANQEQMTLLRSRVYRMEATIDGLLEYARTGQTDGSSESVVVAQLLAEVIDSLTPPPTFWIDIAPMPILTTNRLLLFQVFVNLIGNAIKHHDRSDGSIHISAQERGDCYEFAVSDDGVGIAPEQHERVFRIFQAMNPQNRSDSTGIGLAIVKKIVQAQGGTIWLESQIGEGTTFYFTWLK